MMASLVTHWASGELLGDKKEGLSTFLKFISNRQDRLYVSVFVNVGVCTNHKLFFLLADSLLHTWILISKRFL